MKWTAFFGMISALMLGGFASESDDLQSLKVAAERYVAAMQAVLDLPLAADCSETSSKAREYAALEASILADLRYRPPFELRATWTR